MVKKVLSSDSVFEVFLLFVGVLAGNRASNTHHFSQSKKPRDSVSNNYWDIHMFPRIRRMQDA